MPRGAHGRECPRHLLVEQGGGCPDDPLGLAHQRLGLLLEPLRGEVQSLVVLLARGDAIGCPEAVFPFRPHTPIRTLICDFWIVPRRSLPISEDSEDEQ